MSVSRIKNVSSGGISSSGGDKGSVAVIKNLISTGSLVCFFNGSTLLGKTIVPRGKEILQAKYTKYAAPAKVGYDFTGWSKSRTGAAASSIISDGKPIVLYAVYTLKTSKVSYYDGSRLMGTATVSYDNSVLSPTFSTAKTGYNFNGWTKTDGGTTALTSLKADGNPITLYAIYSIKVSVVSYYNGGTLLGKVNYNYGTNVLNPSGITIPAKTGYNHAGWSKTNGGSALSSLTADGNTITLYTVYTPKITTVSYYDGTNLLGTQTYNFGVDVLHPSLNAAKTGYTLYGWTQTSGATARTTSLTASGATTMVLYAIYLPNSLNIAKVSANSKLWVEVSETYRDSKYISGSLIASASRAGYYAGGGDAEGTAQFTINFNQYQTASVTYRTVIGNGNSHGFIIDGGGWITSEGSWTYTYSTSSPTHTIYAHAVTPGDSWCSNAIVAANITLTNPIAWT